MSKIEQIIENYFGAEQPENLQHDFFLWLTQPSAAIEKERALFAIWDQTNIQADETTVKSWRWHTKRLGWRRLQTWQVVVLRVASIAAAILIPVITAVMAYRYVQTHQPIEPTFLECQVSNGETHQLMLPDSSQVTLNSGTTLIYPDRFATKTRTVYLSGEAKFVVAKNPEKPFVVQSKDMDIMALGTTFNVSAYSDATLVSTTLVSGRVKVNIRNTDMTYDLAPKQQVVYNRETNTSEQTAARLDYALAWENGNMVFQSASLQTIVKRLERRFGVTIYLNVKHIHDEKLTVKFMEGESLEEALYTLKQIIKGFHYRIQGDKIYIY